MIEKVRERHGKSKERKERKGKDNIWDGMEETNGNRTLNNWRGKKIENIVKNLEIKGNIE